MCGMLPLPTEIALELVHNQEDKLPFLLLLCQDRNPHHGSAVS